MNEKIIVVSGAPLRKKWIQYFGYNVLPELVDYELWDASGFYDRESIEETYDDGIEEFEYSKEVEGKDHFQKLLHEAGAQNNPTYVFPLSARHSEVVDIWKASHKYNLNLCFKYHKDHPPKPFRKVTVRRIVRWSRQKMRWLKENIQLSLRYGRPHYAFYATPSFIGKWGNMDGFGNRCYIHNLNYDKFLDLERKTSSSQSYAVYIDQNLPVDHQVKVEGEAFIGEKDFWNRLRVLFDYVTTQTNIDDIVVCAHPNRGRSSLKELSSFCRVVQFQTEKWIRDCSLVIAHASTALDFAVLFEKPICFVGMPEMRRKKFFYEMVHKYAEKLGQEVNILSEEVTPSVNFNVDETLYRKFRDKFIKTPGTPEMNSWEYIVSVLTQQEVNVS